MPEIMLNGPEGRIETRYHQNAVGTAPIALILHPHPLYGGTMNNKVTYHLYRQFVDKGFHTMRFNFRGVGRSEGKFAEGEGELSDAACCLDWLQAKHPAANGVWIAGFSFGAWIGMQLLMRRPEIQSFISVSPPANMYDFNFLAPCPVSGLMVQGGEDKIVHPEAVEKLAKRLSNQKNIYVEYTNLSKADHFFTNNLEELNITIEAYLTNALMPKKQAVNQ